MAPTIAPSSNSGSMERMSIKRDLMRLAYLRKVKATGAEGASHSDILLLYAIRNEWVPGIVKQLLDQGANVNVKDCTKRTPLHIAAEKNNVVLTRLLVNYGADVHAVDIQGRTPLHFAVIYGMLTPSFSHRTVAVNKTYRVVKILLDKGADANARVIERQRTVLHLAAFRGLPNIIQLLLEHGVDTSAVDSENQTAMQYALKMIKFKKPY